MMSMVSVRRRFFPSPLVGSEGRGKTRGSPPGGGRAQLGRMRGVPAWQGWRSVTHPSTVSALRADPPSPTRRALHGTELVIPYVRH
ncbi:MAG: hypothetical protein EOS52_33760, partial [Mesorhizobium sp.]